MLGEAMPVTTGFWTTDGLPGLEIMPGVVVSAVGVTLPESLSFHDWAMLFPVLDQLQRGADWALGDWLNYGEPRWGEDHADAIEITHLEDGTLQNRAWVARRIPQDQRDDRLSYTHHRIVAPIDDPDDRTRWLEMAYEKGWSTRTLQAEIDQARSAALEPEGNAGSEGGASNFSEEVEPVDPVLLEAEVLIGMVTAANDVDSRYHGSYQASKGVWPQFWEQFERMAAIWRDRKDEGDWGWEDA